MARRVASSFLVLLAADRKVALRRTVILAIVAVLLAPAAWFLTPLWGVVAHAGGLVAGALLGWFVAHSLYAGQYTTSVTDDWAGWMQHADESRSVGDLARRVQGQAPRRAAPWAWLGVITLWALLVGLLFVAHIEEGPALPWTLPLLITNGLLCGVFLAASVRAAHWCRTLRASLEEMIREGEIGLGVS